jgi:LuxR family transcriptional regulator, regulator of acetate metabolism
VEDTTPAATPPEASRSTPPAAAWPPRVPRSARDARLGVRVVQALDTAARLLDWDVWEGEAESEDADASVALVEVARSVVAERIRGGVELDRESLVALCDLLVTLEDLRRDLRDSEVDERLRALTGVQAGLGRLRGIASVSAILDLAPQEVCRACGFDRAILFRVQNSQLIAEAVHWENDPDGAAALLEVARENPADLTHMLLETEMIRRRIPMLVGDAKGDPRVHRAIADAADVHSYVAAPIMPEGRVIGFLHADRYEQQRHVDEFDREMLWAFAEGFGYAFERTVLTERMRAQRDQVRGMVQSTEQLMNELCDTEIAVAAVEGEDSAGVGRAAAMLASAPSRLDQLLTRREVEVIKLMAAGETNAGIASRLVISEGTVKSHAKHILRKLRAANRAEAVSRYLRISALGDHS